MLVAAAVCPSTPLVVLGLPELRSACRTAIATLRRARPDALVVVGGAETTRTYDGGVAGTLRPWGVDRRAGTGEPVLPLSLTVARLLLDDTAPQGFQSVAFDATAADCLALGRRLGERAERVALLVTADGPASLSPRAPGRYDEAAGPYHDLIAKAVAAGEPAALAALDPQEADRLWVSGRAALQVLAGAAGTRTYQGRLLAQAAPYGVGYLAGAWLA
ncbi:class III extradiol ring-cleavage dioxygenase family protein [Nonomuraea gerenzanensis]|uniref:Uncharacterized protein n=1 Tax=Nonomuraea gerenzanensis TaxID=93944 RepID=A0A1M4E3P6_9ACTN|nr:hypothetical protein [Nonomuraea gerenzanensis]UBU15664.1 hypothetical protein LCN96_11780 [Nonomuraea gerenzanensis]SBO93437.1 FIG00820085: hypothetical protein [Nonomuraea gerenzanensis]